MKFPNKLFEYKETVIYDCVKILEQLKDDTQVFELYKICKSKCNGSQEFIDALVVLYAIGKIDYDSDKRRIVSVKRDNM
jgi:hypothetical protein